MTQTLRRSDSDIKSAVVDLIIGSDLHLVEQITGRLTEDGAGRDAALTAAARPA